MTHLPYLFFFTVNEPHYQRDCVMDAFREVPAYVTNLIHQHHYDGQLCKHLERQRPPGDDGVLGAEKKRETLQG